LGNFLAKDVAEWIEHSDVSTMLRSVDENEKVTNIVCTLGGNHSALFLTEDGLYELLLQSRKANAKAFKKEVKGILKSIRKPVHSPPLRSGFPDCAATSKKNDFYNGRIRVPALMLRHWCHI
jgi:prophage antirepressor-like protein